MKNTLCKSFYYDCVVDIDTNLNSFKSTSDIVNTKGLKILGVTFNHRGYNIHDKNYIKGLIDFLDIDHLMFSLRPSLSNLIIKSKNIDVIRFKKYSHLSFLLQSMARYEISLGYIDANNLLKTTNILDLCDEVLQYFKEIIIILSNDDNQKRVQLIKDLSSILALGEVKSKLNGKKVLFLENMQFNEIEIEKQLIFKSQISELEKDIFWLGFDPDFKEVPWDKKYEETKWNKIVNNTKFGEASFEKTIKYCNRCCMPETMEGITFDEFGICTPCRSSEEKMHINWEEREKKLNDIILQNRSNNYYDCLLPMSGGKDSMFQAYVLTYKYGLTPLAVTHGANWMSLTGRYNLENCLQKFDLDHLIFHAKRSVINKAARKSLTEIGDACWHCHIGAGTFVIQTALAWSLDLMIWGESIAERDGRGSYINQTEASLYYNLEVSGKVKAEDYIDESLDAKELSKWFYPDKENLKNSKIRYLHLGDYLFWDEEKQVEFVVNEFEWMNSKVENTFKGYKSNECVMAGVHDYANFIKRGIGRATVQASDDIRRGLVTREEGIELAKKYDSQRPHALDFYLKITGFSEKEFEEILIEARKLSKDASKLK
jgi:N-acetyl sugar amidotransferase